MRQMKPAWHFLEELLQDQSQELFAVFWDHFSTTHQSFVRSSGHGIFPDFEEALLYAEAMIARELELHPGIPFESLCCDTDESEAIFVESIQLALADRDTKQICIADRAGNILFASFPTWELDLPTKCARRVFEHSTARQIRENTR
jgi:hypothetical protein